MLYNKICICFLKKGVLTSNPSSFWSYADKSFSDFIYSDSTNLKILLVHEPFIFQEFSPDTWGDILFCGHTHGGVIRVPVLGPLYTHKGGLFPERSGNYVYGRYRVLGSQLIVSGGIENKNLLRNIYQHPYLFKWKVRVIIRNIIIITLRTRFVIRRITCPCAILQAPLVT